MISQVSYRKLLPEQQKAVAKRLDVRKSIYLKAMKLESVLSRVLILGDRPGPAAPTDPTYHHTPFYSIKHCSGWLNALLEVNEINENDLVWINAYDRHGNPTPKEIVEHLDTEMIVALGGNAEKWLRENGFYKYVKVPHPQFWKRFKSKEPYSLITHLKTMRNHCPR